MQRAQDGAEGRFASPVLAEDQGELLERHVARGRGCTEAADRIDEPYLLDRHAAALIDCLPIPSQPLRVTVP